MYHAVEHHVANGIMRHSIREDGTGVTVDVTLTQSGAEHGARLLNSGVCTIDPHAVLGCRIVPAKPNMVGARA